MAFVEDTVKKHKRVVDSMFIRLGWFLGKRHVLVLALFRLLIIVLQHFTTTLRCKATFYNDQYILFNIDFPLRGMLILN